MYSKKKCKHDCPNLKRSSMQVNLSYVSNLSESSSTEPNTSSQELDKNVDNLRKAILKKTREIFDDQNDFCRKTARILDHESFSSDQNDQNEPNSQEKLQKVKNNLSSNESIGKKIAPSSPIISSSQNLYNSTLSNKDIVFGNPVTSSTLQEFTDNCPVNNNRSREILGKTSKTLKPVITSIRSCYVALDKIDGFDDASRSRNLNNISMEMTEIGGNLLVNCENIRESRSLEGDYEKSQSSGSRTSLRVRTSVDSMIDVKDNSRLIHPALKGKSCLRESLSLSEKKGSRMGSDQLSLRVNTSLESRRRSSVVEGTPFPVSRSALWRTMRQSRFMALHRKYEGDEQTGNSGETKVLCETIHADPGPSTSYHQSRDTEPLNHSSSVRAIIEDSSDDGMSNSEPEIRPPTQTIIENSSDFSNDEMSESDEKNRPPKIQPGKRKLFSQLNNSGLVTLSPMQGEPSPKMKTPVGKVKRRRPKKILKITDNQREKGKQTQSNRSTQSHVKFKETLKTLEKKTVKKRKIISKKIVVKKKMNPDVLKVLTNNEEAAPHDCEQGRDSLNDFTDNKRIATKSRHHNKIIYIVTTGLCNGDKDVVKKAVQKIGGARIENSVTRQTTHVVTTGVRTVNLLRGIIRGCWLVSLVWVKKSLEVTEWLSPEKFEIDHFSKAVKENRKDREIFGRSYVPELFTTCGLIYIEHPTSPPRDILKELIKTAGGRIIEDSNKAKIIIGPNGIKEIWALDSITTGELQPTDQYKRQ